MYCFANLQGRYTTTLTSGAKEKNNMRPKWELETTDQSSLTCLSDLIIHYTKLLYRGDHLNPIFSSKITSWRYQLTTVTLSFILIKIYCWECKGTTVHDAHDNFPAGSELKALAGYSAMDNEQFGYDLAIIRTQGIYTISGMQM